MRARSSRSRKRQRWLRASIALAVLLGAPCCDGACNCGDHSQSSGSCISLQPSGGCASGGCNLSQCTTQTDCSGAQVCETYDIGSMCVTPCMTDKDCGPCETCTVDVNSMRVCEKTPSCTCQALGYACATNNDCCSNRCSSGLCASPACAPEGEACSSALDCCNGTCVAGACATPRCVSGPPTQIVADTGGEVATLAQDADTLYWVANGAVQSVPKAGGAVKLLAQGSYSGAIARRGSEVLVATKDAIVSIDDNLPTPVVRTQAPGLPSAIASGPTGTYWSAIQAAPPSFVFGALDASPMTFFKVAEIADTSANVPVVADSNFVYYIDGSAVHRVSLTTLTDTLIYQGGMASQIDGLASDGTAVYFIDAGAFRTCATTSAMASIFAMPATDAVGGIAVDDKAVYWTANGATAPGPTFPFLLKTQKPSGAISALIYTPLANPPDAHGVIVDDQCVYWIEGAAGRIMKMAK